MSFRSRLGVILIVLGLVSLFLPFTREFAIISVFLVVYGVTSIVRSIGGKYRLRGLFGPLRRSSRACPSQVLAADRSPASRSSTEARRIPIRPAYRKLGSDGPQCRPR